jgi:3-isopropylmalate dehydrogenase
MKTIAVLGGDGIGPEVVEQGCRVLREFGLELVPALIGSDAMVRAGSPLPDETVALCRRSDAVLLGAVGGREGAEQGLLGLRKALGLFANLRPIEPTPGLSGPLRPEVLSGVSLLIVRELTGGIYYGEKRREADRATDLCAYNAAEIERVARVAFRLARGRRRLVTSVDKANVLETSRLWREVVTRVAREFPDISLRHHLVDSAAMALITTPVAFDVVLTENLFGDILSDEAAVLAGSLGMLPSASLGEGSRGLYEPVHGTAPDLAGLGVANPYGTILSVAMMLRESLAMAPEAAAVERAVRQSIEAGVRTRDLGGSSTTAGAGDAVLRRMR